MSDSAGWARLAGDRPTRASTGTLVVLWLAWVLVPPLLVFGGAITAAPFLGEQPTAAERSQASTALLLASALALGLPLLGVLLTWRTRKVAAACFTAAVVLVAVPVAMLLAEGVPRRVQQAGARLRAPDLPGAQRRRQPLPGWLRVRGR